MTAELRQAITELLRREAVQAQKAAYDSRDLWPLELQGTGIDQDAHFIQAAQRAHRARRLLTEWATCQKEIPATEAKE